VYCKIKETFKNFVMLRYKSFSVNKRLIFWGVFKLLTFWSRNFTFKF